VTDILHRICRGGATHIQILYSHWCCESFACYRGMRVSVTGQRSGAGPPGTPKVRLQIWETIPQRFDGAVREE
jgi:hypothetical protein